MRRRIWKSCTLFVRYWMSCVPNDPVVPHRNSDYLCAKTVPGMTAATRSMPARSNANWAGGRRRLSRAAFRKTISWYLAE